MIHTENLTKSFGDRRLWRDLDLTVHGQRMVALVGASGSGKTTLLNCLGLLEPPTRGRIVFGGRDLAGSGPGRRRRFRRDHLGYLFQDYALIDNATVRANLEVARRAKAADRAVALERVGLGGREKETVHHLSGGEQQRVALARLMVKRPSVVLADEPTGALDEANTAMVMDVLREMARNGCAVVIATHDTGVADACDEVFDVSEQEFRATRTGSRAEIEKGAGVGSSVAEAPKSSQSPKRKRG